MMFQMNLLLLGLNAAEELSYLNNESQKLVYSAIKYYECTPSIMQSRQIRKLSNEDKLTYDEVEKIFKEPKGNQQEQIKFNKKRI